MEKLLRYREAGEVSGLGERMIRRLVERRELAHYRVSSRVFVSAADLERYLAERRIEKVG